MTLFCGIDWAESHHDVAIINAAGQLVAKKRIPDDPAGFAELLAEAGDSAEPQVPVAIETPRGLVASLRATGRPRSASPNCVVAGAFTAVDEGLDALVDIVFDPGQHNLGYRGTVVGLLVEAVAHPQVVDSFNQPGAQAIWSPTGAAALIAMQTSPCGSGGTTSTYQLLTKRPSDARIGRHGGCQSCRN